MGMGPRISASTILVRNLQMTAVRYFLKLRSDLTPQSLAIYLHEWIVINRDFWLTTLCLELLLLLQSVPLILIDDV